MVDVLEGIVEREVVIKEGRVVSLKFGYDCHEYDSKITPTKISLSLESGSHMTAGYPGRLSSIAVFDRKTGISRWDISHCCGISGFDGMRDTCYAHNLPPDGRLELNPENMDALYHASEYNQRLAEVLSSGILSYCKKIEDKLKGK